MFQSTKSFFNYPCAHRQPWHRGNCALVHGYSRSFHFTFGAHTRDACGFVVDFGELDWLKHWLEEKFDHTLLLVQEDPLLPLFRDIETGGGARIVIAPLGVGMEDTAQWVCEYTDSTLRRLTKGRCWVECVEVRENEKNSGLYVNPDAGFKGWL